MSKKQTSLNITILGDKGTGKSHFINNYIVTGKFKSNKDKKNCISFIKTIGDQINVKLNIYEYTETNEKSSKDLQNNQCIIIMFDMTSRTSFEDVLDKWIKYLREAKYSNTIILLGNIINKNALPMTDEEEIKELIDVTEINGKFYDIGRLNDQEKANLIDKLINAAYEESKNSKGKKEDCNIF